MESEKIPGVHAPKHQYISAPDKSSCNKLFKDGFERGIVKNCTGKKSVLFNDYGHGIHHNRHAMFHGYTNLCNNRIYLPVAENKRLLQPQGCCQAAAPGALGRNGEAMSRTAGFSTSRIAARMTRRG